MWEWGRDLSVCSVLFPRDSLFWVHAQGHGTKEAVAGEMGTTHTDPRTVPGKNLFILRSQCHLYTCVGLSFVSLHYYSKLIGCYVTAVYQYWFYAA